MKILITGASGQLGSDCARLFSQKRKIIALSSKQLDITQSGAVEDAFRTFTPDIVLNCAAYTKVDACETDRKHAWKVNADGPANLAQCAKKYECTLVHVSTDYVFDGRKTPPLPYTETDETLPLSYYGRTKLEGERAVRRTTENHIIVRTAWLFGINAHNFLKTMLKVALKNPGGSVKVVNDQFGSPTWSLRLAEQIAVLIEHGGRGTYHATSEGYCTWFELATYFLGAMGIEYTVIPCSSKDYPTPARRPENSILENKRLKEENINIMPFWRNEVDEFIRTYKESLLRECSI